MSKYSGHGIQLQMGDGAASESFTTVAQVESVTPPGWTQGTEMVPAHDDTAGTGVEKLADALYDAGEVSFTILEDLDDGTHDETTGLHSKKGATSSTNFKVILPSSLGTIDFAAFVTNYSYQGIDANTGKIRADVTLDITGSTTIT